MKQNITLSINKDLIKKVKILAAQKQTSISGINIGCPKANIYQRNA